MHSDPNPCPVCYAREGGERTILTLPCAHRICDSCLFQLRRLVCPICRRGLFPHAEAPVRYMYVIHESTTDDDMTESVSMISFYETLTDDGESEYESDSHSDVDTEEEEEEEDRFADGGNWRSQYPGIIREQLSVSLSFSFVFRSTMALLFSPYEAAMVTARGSTGRVVRVVTCCPRTSDDGPILSTFDSRLLCMYDDTQRRVFRDSISSSYADIIAQASAHSNRPSLLGNAEGAEKLRCILRVIMQPEAPTRTTRTTDHARQIEFLSRWKVAWDQSINDSTASKALADLYRLDYFCVLSMFETMRTDDVLSILADRLDRDDDERAIRFARGAWDHCTREKADVFVVLGDHRAYSHVFENEGFYVKSVGVDGILLTTDPDVRGRVGTGTSSVNYTHSSGVRIVGRLLSADEIVSEAAWSTLWPMTTPVVHALAYTPRYNGGRSLQFGVTDLACPTHIDAAHFGGTPHIMRWFDSDAKRVVTWVSYPSMHRASLTVIGMLGVLPIFILFWMYWHM